MKRENRLIFGLVPFLGLIFVLVSCSSGEGSAGVARIDQSREIGVVAEDEPQTDPNSNQSLGLVLDGSSLDTTDMSQEEIATLFTSCLRDEGLNTPDPVLNADGTVDWQALRMSVQQDPKFIQGSRDARDKIEACRPFLEGANLSQRRAAEDEIELQDTLLEFAQCLREEGINVQDPDFSGGPRSAMQSMLQDANTSSTVVQEVVRGCRDLHFGNRDGRGGGERSN